MHLPVSIETAKLLKEKNIVLSVKNWYHDIGMYRIPHYRLQDYNDGGLAAPTIAEVVMWLYEKHGIWIYVQKDYGVKFLGFEGIIEAKDGFVCCDTCKDINPAYEAAIKYTLTNLINIQPCNK